MSRAREFGIPAVVGIGDQSQLKDGETVTLPAN
ncbi:PEP-utilizing enzyme [Microbulbifer litoralis]